MKLIIISFFILISLSDGFGQKAKVIKLPELESIMARNEDTTYIINFMATWCKPCMEELPGFEKFSKENATSNIKVIYISLDAVEDLDKKLNKMIERKRIKNSVYLLDETDYDSWIRKIEKSWQGSIPVTFIINHSRKIRKFIPSSITYNELASTIKNIK